MPWAGSSEKHNPDSLAVNTGNGVGAHNIQMFFLSADGIVLNCLTGFWNPEDLQAEANLAARLNQVWLAPNLTREQKTVMFQRMQIAHIKTHSADMTRRSHLVKFDEQFELSKPKSDFVCTSSILNPAERAYHSQGHWFKPTDVVMHQRMARRPFVAYRGFDVATYSDIGSTVYDLGENAWSYELAERQKHLEQMEENRKWREIAIKWSPERFQSSTDEVSGYDKQNEIRTIKQRELTLEYLKRSTARLRSTIAQPTSISSVQDRGVGTYSRKNSVSPPATTRTMVAKQETIRLPEYKDASLRVRAKIVHKK